MRRVLDGNLFTGAAIMRLTGTATLVSLAFITATSAVPLWLVTEKGLATDDALLGWTLGLFSLSAGAGAVAGGFAGTRLGYGRTALVSLTAAGVVIGIGHALAGLLYVGVGVLQGVFGLATSWCSRSCSPVPAALISVTALERQASRVPDD